MHTFFQKYGLAALLCLLFGSTIFAQAPASVNIKNEEKINSDKLEFSPTFYEDGVVFISTNTVGEKKYRDRNLKTDAMSILHSIRALDGDLSQPDHFSSNITSRYHEGPVCFNATADTMYFSRNVILDGRERKAKDGELKMNLYRSTFNGSTWGEGEPLSFNSKEFDDCHPAISLEGDKLLFSSNREGGFGGMDLYVSYRVGSEWSEPINLGASVNTEANEAFPFLHADNTLYFASDKADGSGGFDIYYALYDGTTWLAPTNIGSPFNTSGDDLGLIVDLDKKNGYFASNGNGGQGKDDIFSFKVENGNLDDFLLENNRVSDQTFDAMVTVLDMNGQPVQDAGIRFINLDRSNVVGRDSLGNPIILENIDGQAVLSSQSDDAIISGMTDENGAFATGLPIGKYLMVIAREGYETHQSIRVINKPGNFITVNLDGTDADKLPFKTVLYNDATDAPLAGAMLVLTNAATGEMDTIYTDENGAVDAYLDKNAQYNVDIYKDGLKIGETNLDTSTWPDSGIAGDDGGNMNMVLNIDVPALPKGTAIELPNIYYNFNDASLRPDAKKDLDLVAALMKQYPEIELEVGSHTDSRGKTAYNNKLSQERAQNVLEFLAANGIDPDRWRPIGYGEKQRRNKCRDGVKCSEREHARNRRTEIKVISGADDVVVKRYDSSLGLGPSGSGISSSGANGNRPSFSSNTQFYLVCGSFLMENRAKNRLAEVKSRGYSSAKVQQFSGSPFYSVCVELFSDYDIARAKQRDFERKENINSYIKPVRR